MQKLQILIIALFGTWQNEYFKVDFVTSRRKTALDILNHIAAAVENVSSAIYGRLGPRTACDCPL